MNAGLQRQGYRPLNVLECSQSHQLKVGDRLRAARYDLILEKVEMSHLVWVDALLENSGVRECTPFAWFDGMMDSGAAVVYRKDSQQ